jgi:hypothetical protein
MTDYVDMGLEVATAETGAGRVMAVLGAAALGAAAVGLARTALVCQDGTVMSIVAGRNLYSEPRSDDAEEYTEVEIGMWPEDQPGSFSDVGRLPGGGRGWITDDPVLGKTSDQVYAYMPVENIGAAIQAHGGVKAVKSVYQEIPRSCYAEIDQWKAAASRANTMALLALGGGAVVGGAVGYMIARR